MPIIVGIAGGSGSGKTTFARLLRDHIGETHCEIITQDSYYFDQSHLFDRDGGRVNFDHPHSIDAELLSAHLQLLRNGSEVLVPTYDFKTHSRVKPYRKVLPKPVIVVDGILVLHWPEVREHLAPKIFIETHESIRFERRLVRDTRERGRTAQGVREQFESQVKPMHDLFVEPSKTFAGLVISGERAFNLEIQTLAQQLISLPDSSQHSLYSP